MKYLLTVSLLLAVFSSNAQTTTYQYDLKVSGNSVGTLTVTKKVEGNKKTYTSDSESVVHLFGETSIKTHQEATYINNELVSSLNQVWKDGNLYDETKVEQQGGTYSITRNGTTSTLNEPIPFSSIRLYFHIPESISSVFSETEGVFKNISDIGNNTYQLSDNGNHVNKYIYENGILQEAVINHTIVDVLILWKK